MIGPLSIEGIKFIAAFPEWADHRAKVTQFYDYSKDEPVIIVAHPDHPPHRLDLETKKWNPVAPITLTKGV